VNTMIASTEAAATKERAILLLDFTAIIIYFILLDTGKTLSIAAFGTGRGDMIKGRGPVRQ